MLQALRDKSTGWITIVILGFLAFLLVLSGLQGYVVSATDTSVAKVGDAEVRPEDFATRLEAKRAGFERSGQDPTTFDTPERRREVLDELVIEKLLEQASQDGQLRYSTQAIRDAIARDPMFQKDGKFDNGTFVNLLAQNNLTEAEYVRRLADAFRKNILPAAVGSSALVTDADLDAFVKLRDQTRSFRYFLIAAADMPALTPATDAELKTYYDQNHNKYMSTEYVDVEYIRVQQSQLPKVEATEAVLKARYDEQSTRFKTPERRQAAHILIEVEGGETATPEQQKQALATANEVLGKIKAGGDFAQLAEQYSKDLGSSTQGGDLGFIERGTSEPAFEAKLFAMQVGEVSEPVLSSQGYHVIKLVELEAEAVKTFEQARPELEAEFYKEEADKAFNMESGKLVDAAQADPRALASAAKVTGLKSVRTGFISALGASKNNAPFEFSTNAEFLRAAFSPKVLERGENSDLITIAPGDALILRVAQREPSQLKPFEQVRAEVVSAFDAERSNTALKKKAEELAKSVTDVASFEAQAGTLKKTIEVADNAGRNAANRDPALSAAVFKAARPSEAKPVFLNAELSPSQIAIIELSKVTDGDPKAVDAATRDSLRLQLSYEIAQVEIEGLKSSLRKAATIVLHEDRIVR